MSQLNPIVPVGYESVRNCQAAYASATTLTVAAGNVWDSTGTINMVVSSSLTISSASAGALGLDTGTVANSTWYYVHVIGDSTGKNLATAFISTSRTAPTLPFGYDSFRWVGQARTNGSAQFLIFYSYGNNSDRTYYWDTVVSVLSSGTGTTLTAIDLTGGVIPVDNTSVVLEVAFTPNTAGDGAGITAYGSTATIINNITGVVATKAQNGQLKVISKLNSGAPKVLYIVAASGSLSALVSAFDYSL